jgi:acetyl esterase/lipase
MACTTLRVAIGLLPVLLTAACVTGHPQVIPLWPAGAPGSEGAVGDEVVRVNEYGEHIVSNVHHPSITTYLPSGTRSRGAAVIVIPGGGHTELWMDHEGYRIGQFLADHGVAAFVLKYRLARAAGSPYTIEGNSLPDVQRAIRVVKNRAAAWHVDPDRVGVMGFSAGGELAALAGARFDGGRSGSIDPVERLSSRPGFEALLYPSIPRDLQPSKATPPAFLLCGADDQPAVSRGVAELYLAFRAAGVPAELHIYSGAGHGFGIRARNQGPVAGWPWRFLEWLNRQPNSTTSN